MNKVNTSTFLSGFIVMCVLFIVSISCGIGTTKIGDIISHPRDYAGKEVTISGEVTETFSLIFVKYFVVRSSPTQNRLNKQPKTTAWLSPAVL